jgi:DNA-binding transcriptional MerR regulator
MSDAQDPGLTLARLSERADVTPRTVRYYIRQGLLPSPGAGPRPRYDERHVKLLRLVKELQRQHLPLAEIRARLHALDDEGIDRLLAEPQGAIEGSALDYVRSLLETRSGRVTPSERAPWAMRPQASVRSEAAPLAGAGAKPAAPIRYMTRRASTGPASEPPAPMPPAAMPMSRSQWERLALSPDIELHIRRPLSRQQNKQVERLVPFARQLLEEDTP